MSSDFSQEIETQKTKSSFWDKFKEPEYKSLLILLGIALVVRLLFSLIFNSGHPTDINNFKVWGLESAKRGIYTFFQPTPTGVWCDYPPGYIYILYAFSKVYQIFDPTFQHWSGTIFTTFIKFPGIIADIFNVAIIYTLTRKYVPHVIAMSSASLYAFHPAIFYESTIWGQMDSVSTLFLLMSVIYLMEKKYASSVFITAVNCLMKPQGILLIPFIGFVLLYKKAFKQTAIGVASSFALVFALTLPITKDITEVLPWLWEHYTAQADLYPFSSIQAFNLWALTGVWKNDTRTILGVTHKLWGLILFIGLYLSAIGYYVIRSKETETENKKKKDINLIPFTENLTLINASTIILIGFFMLPTRMHERYLFPGLTFLAISAALNFKFKNIYYILSGIFFINLLYEFPGDKTNLGSPILITNLANFLKSGTMYNTNFGVFWFTPFVIANLYLFGLLLMKLWKEQLVEVDENEVLKLENENKVKEDSNVTSKNFIIPALQKIDSKDWMYIGLIALGSTLLRLFYLTYPEEMIFDEVYHSRAAAEYLRGISPFEWVHPPLAKLLISVGVYFFGLNSFGWRIVPVLFGTLFVPVMYIFGKTMFEKRSLGVLAAVIISLDGVFFVQSRTAMTNIIATFFQITAVLFFWLYVQNDYHKEKKKAFIFFTFSGIFMSLALASRWTSMGALAFILGSMIWYKLLFNMTFEDLIKFNFKPIIDKISLKELPFWIYALICFAVFPAIAYVLAYIPYLNLNHTISEMLEMQKNIYNYHKNLRDPHPYYSEWYTWPFLIRPTWYYFRDFKDGTMAGIIALGNPAIWWSSLFVTGFSIFKALKEKKAHLLYIGLGFIILYLPWAVSPRIKNYNHYLFEAIPYACLSITYLLNYLWEKGNEQKELNQEDKNFNLMAMISVGALALSSLFVGGLALWTLQWKNPFPISFLANYQQNLFNSVPYMLASLSAIIIYTLYENSKYKTLSIIYGLSIVGMFIFFYPMYAGYPMSWTYYSLHIWMKSWI